jgi:predicted nuclease of predicted toxin-antitoxin system
VTLRFLLDEDLSHRVATGLRRRGVDAVSVYEIGRSNRRIPDSDQLDYAASEGRVLLTYNRADYQALDAQWRAQGRSHAGILWCAERSIPRRAIGDLVRAIEAAASAYDSLTGICMPLQRP